MLKVELHTHTADDPVDRIPHTTLELIDRAVALGYDALAITLHDRQLDLRHLTPYAADRGLVLIPGVERTIEGRHVLLLNFQPGHGRCANVPRSRPAEVAATRTRRRARIRSFRRPYVSERISNATPICSTPWNATRCSRARSISIAAPSPGRRRHGKPVVGNCDVHRLWQLGTTYSLVDAPPDADAICNAIAAGRVQVESRPLAWAEVARVAAVMALGNLSPRVHGWTTSSTPVRTVQQRSHSVSSSFARWLDVMGFSGVGISEEGEVVGRPDARVNGNDHASR